MSRLDWPNPGKAAGKRRARATYRAALASQSELNHSKRSADSLCQAHTCRYFMGFFPTMTSERSDRINLDWIHTGRVKCTTRSADGFVDDRSKAVAFSAALIENTLFAGA